jgi:hypothetical protein
MDINEIRANAAISAMQGILESGKLGEVLELTPSLVAKQSVRLANELVNELNKRTTNDELEEQIAEEVRNIFKKNAK